MPHELPLFPLGIVQFPGSPLDLQIFEQRYLQMLDDLEGRDPQEFGVVAISSGHEVGRENLHGLEHAGCAVRVERTRRVGARVLLRAVGTWRFDQIDTIERETPYLTARVRPLLEGPADASDGPAVAELRSALIAYADAAEIELGTVPADPDDLTWWVAASAPLTRAEQVQLLSAPRAERLALLTRSLRRERRLLRSTSSVPFASDRRTHTN